VILNILFIADVSIARVIGGAERVLFEQSTRLARRGNNVHILTRRLGLHTSSSDTIQGVKEWRYDVDVKKNAITFLIQTARNSKRLCQYVSQEHKIDLINIFQPFSGLGTFQQSVGRRIKKIYTCHSLSFEEFISRNEKPAGMLQKCLYALNVFTRKWIEKRVLLNCDEILVLSRFTSEKLRDIYKIPEEKTTVIPGGVDLSHFYPADNKHALREKYDLPTNKVVLLTVRNLVKRMGLENLVHALKTVVNYTEDVYLIIGGCGPLKDELITLTKNLGIDNYVCFTGFIPEAQLADYYRMADLFVLPTTELEGFGLVTLEAMASGLPVVGTPVGGTNEILGQFDRSLIFEGTDPDSIAALILENSYKIQTNPYQWQSFCRKCRHFVQTHYSWEKNVDALKKHFPTQPA